MIGKSNVRAWHSLFTAPWTTIVRFNRVTGPMELAENVCTRDHRM